jgi:hypothetical protein
VADLPGARTLFAWNADVAKSWNPRRARLWRDTPAVAVARVRELAGVLSRGRILERRMAPNASGTLAADCAMPIPFWPLEPHQRGFGGVRNGSRQSQARGGLGGEHCVQARHAFPRTAGRRRFWAAPLIGRPAGGGRSMWLRWVNRPGRPARGGARTGVDGFAAARRRA